MVNAISQLVTLTLNPKIVRRIYRTKFRPPKPPRIKPEPRPKGPLGRPKMPDEKWATIKRLAEDPALSCNQIARIAGVAYSTVTKYRRENGLIGPGSPGGEAGAGGGVED